MKKIVLLFFMVLFVSCHGDFVELSDKYVYCEYTIAKSPSKSRWTSDGKYIPYTVVIFDIMCKEQNVQISLGPKYDTDAE